MQAVSKSKPSDIKVGAPVDAVMKKTGNVADGNFQQRFESTIDCAALLAVRESASGREMQSGTAIYDRVTFALGKAKEYAQQAHIDSAQVKILYGEKTLDYFGLQEEDATGFLQQTSSKAHDCEMMLRQYEPSAQIQDAIQHAVKSSHQ